jgi:transcriptional regulator with XRE-family HTH domain
VAIKSNQDLLTKAQVSLGLRMGRAALGWSQDEFAMRLDWAKTTLGRAETMEGGLRTEQFVQAMALLGAFGVTVQFSQDGSVSVSVGANGVQEAITRLTNEQFRRSDRRKPLGGLSTLSTPQTKEVDSPLGRLATKKKPPHSW